MPLLARARNHLRCALRGRLGERCSGTARERLQRRGAEDFRGGAREARELGDYVHGGESASLNRRPRWEEKSFELQHHRLLLAQQQHRCLRQAGAASTTNCRASAPDKFSKNFIRPNRDFVTNYKPTFGSNKSIQRTVTQICSLSRLPVTFACWHVAFQRSNTRCKVAIGNLIAWAA